MPDTHHSVGSILESTTAEPVGTDFTIWSSQTHIICNKFESPFLFITQRVLQELKQLYAKLFSVPEYSRELPVSYRKYTTLKLNRKQLGSHRIRSSSSSVVMVSWNYKLFGPSMCTTSSVQSSEDGEDRPVRINYFAVHTCTLCETARDVKIILFSASWFKFHPNKDSCGKPVTIWECDIFTAY